MERAWKTKKCSFDLSLRSKPLLGFSRHEQIFLRLVERLGAQVGLAAYGNRNQDWFDQRLSAQICGD
jgi:hypothetical protein